LLLYDLLFWPAAACRRRPRNSFLLVPTLLGVLPKRDKASPARESRACHATTAYQGHAEPFGSAQGRLREASLPATGSKSNPGLALRPVGRQRFFASLRMTPYWRRGVEQRPNDPPGASPRLGNTPSRVGTPSALSLARARRASSGVPLRPLLSLNG